MHRIVLIAGKEWREFWRSGQLICLFVAALLLLIVSIGMGWNQQQASRTERAAAQQSSYETWLNQHSRNPHAAAHFGMYVFKPVPLRALFDPGLNPYLGTAVYLETHVRNEFKFRPADDNTGLLQFGGFSPAWVIQVLAPVIIIALGFRTFAGERESGTLHQAISSGVNMTHLLWGKALAIGAVIAVYLLPAAVASIALMLTNSATDQLLPELARLLAIGIGYTAYLASFIFFTLAVSAWVTNTRLALLILLVSWMINAMIAPRVTADLARQLHPLMSLGELDNAVETDRRKAINKMIKETFKVDLLKQVPKDKLGRSLLNNDEISFPILDHHFGSVETSLQHHQELQIWGGLFAPLLAIRDFSMGMAGTDFASHGEFSAAAERHRRLISDVMNRDILHHAGAQGIRYRADAELWKKIPPFDYHPPAFAWSLIQHWPSALILVIDLIVSISLALIAVNRLHRPLEVASTFGKQFLSLRSRRALPAPRLPCFGRSAVGTLFAYEWRLLTADRSLGIIACLTVLLSGYGLYNGFQRIQQQEQNLAAVLEEREHRIATLLDRLPKILAGIEEPDFILNPADPVWASGGWAGGAAQYAYLPTLSLAPVALGATDMLPHYFRVTSRDQTNFIQQSSIESPWQLMAGHFDMAFVVIYLFPLIIFALTYNLLSQEREQGTIKLLLAQPISLTTVIVGKAGLRACVLLTLIVLLPMAVILSTRPELELFRLLMWACVVLAYGLFWFALSIFVNALGKSSAANAAILISVWMLLVLIVPVGLNTLITHIEPVSSRTMMITRLRQALSELAKRHDAVDFERSNFGQLSLVATRSDKAARFMQLDLEATTQPMLDQFKADKERQLIWVKRLSFLSPAILASESMSDIAGNGVQRYRLFRQQITHFHREWRAFFEPKIESNMLLTPADYAAMPTFHWQEENLFDLILRSIMALLGILLPTFIVLAIAAVRFRQFSVT